MFHGGTNFAFMNGANEQTENDQLKNGQDYKADTTSYGIYIILLDMFVLLCRLSYWISCELLLFVAILISYIFQPRMLIDVLVHLRLIKYIQFGIVSYSLINY